MIYIKIENSSFGGSKVTILYIHTRTKFYIYSNNSKILFREIDQ